MTEGDDPFWPTNEPGLGDPGARGWYYAALVCRRGHMINSRADEQVPDPGTCSTCGANVLTACPSCGLRLRGRQNTPGVASLRGQTPRPFCDRCGSPMPWTNRQQRIYGLMNILDEEDISEYDRLPVTEDLQRLQADDGSMTEEQQGAAWERVKERAPGLFSGYGKPIITGLVGAWLKTKLGL